MRALPFWCWQLLFPLPSCPPPPPPPPSPPPGRRALHHEREEARLPHEHGRRRLCHALRGRQGTHALGGPPTWLSRTARAQRSARRKDPGGEQAAVLLGTPRRPGAAVAHADHGSAMELWGQRRPLEDSARSSVPAPACYSLMQPCRPLFLIKLFLLLLLAVRSTVLCHDALHDALQSKRACTGEQGR